MRPTLCGGAAPVVSVRCVSGRRPPRRAARRRSRRRAWGQPVTIEALTRMPGGASRETWSFTAREPDGVGVPARAAARPARGAGVGAAARSRAAACRGAGRGARAPRRGGHRRARRGAGRDLHGHGVRGRRDHPAPHPARRRVWPAPGRVLADAVRAGPRRHPPHPAPRRSPASPAVTRWSSSSDCSTGWASRTPPSSSGCGGWPRRVRPASAAVGRAR